jgi:hypothetical protein
MTKRFNNCGLSTAQPDEGVLVELPADILSCYEEESQRESRYLTSRDPIKVAIAGAFRFSWGDAVRIYGIFHFRPQVGFVEADGSAQYKVFQIPVRQPGGFKYIYIILDDLLACEDEGGDIILRSYRLRGVSNLIPIATPEYDWCNADESWQWWSKEPADFNVGAGVTH